MTKLRAVLFDRDDTLSVMDASVYRQAAAWAAEQFGLDTHAALSVMQRHWETEFGGWWALRSLEDEQVFWQAYAARLAAQLKLSTEQGTALVAQFPYHAFMKPAPQVREVLLELRRRGMKIGVLSNTLPDIWPTLQAIGVADVVDVALSSCLLGVHKPGAEVFVLAAQALEVAPAAVLFLDDQLENVLAARAVGMRAEQVDLSAQVEGAIWKLEEVLALV